MAHGREDFTYLADTDITAVSVASIAVDIIAQTIAALKINITAQDLASLKTDIVAQTLATLKMDITAQTLAALKMDITAQTLAALKVDITAQTLAALKIDIITQTLAALKINITAQDLAQLVISISAQTVGVYLQPEWSAKVGVDKNFRTVGGNKAWGENASLDYVVTAGKTLYITGIAYGSVAAQAVNFDRFLYVKGFIYNVTADAYLAEAGGVGGGNITFPKPLAIPGGETVRFMVYNYSDTTCTLAVTAWGYEV